MNSLPAALALSLRQLGDPAILKVLVKTTLITLAIFLAGGAVFYVAIGAALASITSVDFGGLGALAAVAVTLVAGWFLFRVVALFILQFFAEDVVRAVEARHYPQAAGSLRKLSFRQEMRSALRSLLRTVLANGLALPIAGVLILSGIGPFLVFFAVNAFLVGRELQDVVWLPHRADPAEIAPMNAATGFLLGGTVVALLAIPFVNLLAPIIGAAAATHMVHRAREKVPDA